MQKVLDMIQEAELSDYFPPGAASKMRGTLGFLSTYSWGKVGRGGMGPLIRREYYDKSVAVDTGIRRCFAFFDHLLRTNQPRSIPATPDCKTAFIVVSDGQDNENTKRQRPPWG